MQGFINLFASILRHPANRGTGLKPLFLAFYWQVYKRFTGKPLDISYNGFQLRCYPKSRSASRALYYSSLPDYWEMQFMLDYLKEGDNFIDCGANIGLYSLLARSKVGASGNVDPFEPNQSVAKQLLENINLNEITNITVHKCGLSDRSEKLNLVMTGDDSTSYVGNKTTETPLLDSKQIPLVRLDEHLDNQSYAMAKFDIEGYEPFAIRGASRWTADLNPPVMLIEMAGCANLHGVTTADFVQELAELGYYIAIYCPATKALKKTTAHWEMAIENVLAIAHDQEDLVNRRLRQ